MAILSLLVAVNMGAPAFMSFCMALGLASKTTYN